MKVAMLNTLRVKDVMTDTVVTLRSDAPIDEAWQRLHGMGVTGAPVVDAKGRVVGVVSNHDFSDPRRRRTSEQGAVDDIMTRIAYAVRTNDPISSAVRLMIDENIHRVLVVNDDGTLAGIVVPIDILRALAQSFDDAQVDYFDLRKLRNS